LSPFKRIGAFPDVGPFVGAMDVSDGASKEISVGAVPIKFEIVMMN
jgi:hypothetical protein